MIKINIEKLSYFQLRKQNLFQKAPQKEISKVISSIGGIYSSSPTCYLSLLARVTDFQPKMLEELIGKKRKLYRMPLMRRTVFILPVETLPITLGISDRIIGSSYDNLLARLGINVDSHRFTLRKRFQRTILRIKNIKKQKGE